MSTHQRPRVHHRVPSLFPRTLRMRLFDWHPGRDARWRRYPGIRTVAGSSAALTFDDGPARDATPAVLDALARAEVKATFFLLGRETESEPELARQIADGGHEIALHGYEHTRQDRLGAAEARADIEAGLRAVREVTGARPRWYRPPFGRMSAAGAQACRELDLGIAYWSGWGLDWEEVASQAIADRVCSNLGAGSVVLLHDSAVYGRRASAAPTAAAIGPIASYGMRKGLIWRTLSEAEDAARQPARRS